MDQLLDAIRTMRRDLGLDVSPHVACMHVTFDDQGVSLRSRDAGGEHALQATFAWEAIRRICFKDNGPMASDKIYVIADDRTFVVPLEAVGGGDFWRQLRVRGVVPPELHEQATLSMDGQFYCWPPLGKDAPQAPLKPPYRRRNAGDDQISSRLALYLVGGIAARKSGIHESVSGLLVLPLATAHDSPALPRSRPYARAERIDARLPNATGPRR